MEKADKLQLLCEAVKSYPDFPKPGILFRDIFGIFKNVAAMQAMRDLLVGHVAMLDVDFICGLDSRGFLIGTIVSFELAKPFIPIRKKGKLPGNVIEQSFTKEYGEDVLEMQTDLLQRGSGNKAIIIDDLLATGGTMAAAEKLVKSAGAKVMECLVVLELKCLKGRQNIEAPVHSLLQYD